MTRRLLVNQWNDQWRNKIDVGSVNIGYPTRFAMKRIAIRIGLDVKLEERRNSSAKYDICSLQYVCKCEC